MRLSLRRMVRLVFALAVFAFFFGFLSPLRAAEPSTANAALAWAWSVNCPCANGCQCSPGNGCGCELSAAKIAASPVAYRDVQVCEDGKCKIVRVPLGSTQNSEPFFVSTYAADCAGGSCSLPTTVRGSTYGAASGASGASGFKLFHPFQNLQHWNQSRPKLFNGGRLFGGKCGGCGGCGG